MKQDVKYIVNFFHDTVVPALGDPVMSGHLTSTAMLSMSRHIPTLNYLRSADACLTRTRTVIYWLSVPIITDSSNKCRVFGGHFNPKSLTAHTLSYDRLFAQIPMLPSGDRKQYFISHTLWLHSFYEITSSELNPRCRRRERFLVLTSAHREDCGASAIEMVRGNTQIAHPSLRRAATCDVRTPLPGPVCPLMTGTTVPKLNLLWNEICET